ncbi:MAG: acylphosphatase [Alphaproteobacteria bacterium]
MGTARALSLRIAGRVQGVWYRSWMVGEADRLGLRGWVRNRRDGTVEALIIGSETGLAAMVDLCREGPPAARVETVETTAAADDGSQGFRQEATG